MPPLPAIFRADPVYGWPRDNGNEILGVGRNPEHLLALIDRDEAVYYFTFRRMLQWYMDGVIPGPYWDKYIATLEETIVPSTGEPHPDRVAADSWHQDQDEMQLEMSRAFRFQQS